MLPQLFFLMLMATQPLQSLDLVWIAYFAQGHLRRTYFYSSALLTKYIYSSAVLKWFQILVLSLSIYVSYTCTDADSIVLFIPLQIVIVPGLILQYTEVWHIV